MLYFIFPYFGLNLPSGVVLFSMFMLITLYAKQLVMEYRIRRGYYGNCYSEVREVVHFLIKNNKLKYNNDDGDSSKGGRTKQTDEAKQNDRDRSLTTLLYST